MERGSNLILSGGTGSLAAPLEGERPEKTEVSVTAAFNIQRRQRIFGRVIRSAIGYDRQPI